MDFSRFPTNRKRKRAMLMAKSRNRNPTEQRALTAKSPRPNLNGEREVGDSYIKNGVSYVQIYKKDFDSDDEGSADDHIHQNDCCDPGWKPNNDPDPTIEEEEEEGPPYIIAVQGPPKVGKSLLIKSLVSFYTGENHCDLMAGPIRILAGNKRRIQFVECPNNVNGMIDASKYADAVIFLIDAGYGFEMETFEFLQLLKVHGMPKVMGVLTYLDTFRSQDMLEITRELLLDQFQTEICNGAQVFCLSGLDDNATYLKPEISMLATYISTMEFHPVSWRAAHPYLLVDYFEDVTPQETIQMDEECSRKIILKGYLRGCDSEDITKVHVAGFGDFPLASVTSLIDPFPLPPGDGDVDEVIRTEIEGFRAGTYVRFEVCDVPSVMIKNYDPGQPILVGGITTEEENVGHIQVKLELHSWNLKILKSKDPIIVSVGCRRYQTTPIYARKDRHGKYWLLNHTPKNSRCYALLMGPHAAPKTGLAIVQSLADDKAAFRFLGKGCVVGVNQAPHIYKKSKRIGTPCKISKKTAFIKGMFTSDLEIANFKNAKVQTASGIYGRINKPAGKDLIRGLESQDVLPREGIAECRFKRKIRKCDRVFMPEEVDVPCFFNTIMTGPELLDRIWETGVDTSGCQLPVPADYYKGNENPFAAEDRGRYKMLNYLPVLREAAVTKKQKDFVEAKYKELRDACAKRIKEMRSTKRRQTIEQLRAVRFHEGEKKQKVTKMSEEELGKRHVELIKGFKEYIIKEERCRV